MPPETTINVGVLGATGYIGTPYRRELRDVSDVRIIGLCGRRKDLLSEAAEEDQASLVTDNWREVVESPQINFVIVATPDALHHEAVLACARSGKHVLCEKPVGKNRREAKEMLEAYQAGKLAHFVPFWTRYCDIFRRAKEIFESGQLGDIRGIVYRWHNPRPADMPHTWRDDENLSAGGSIADVGSHAYDTVCWILNGRAKWVLTHAATITPPKADLGPINLDEALRCGADSNSSAGQSNRELRAATTPDYASISWEFASGAVGSLIVSHASPFRKGVCPELEMHGTQASLGINRVTGDVVLCESGKTPKCIDNIPDRGLGNRFEQYVLPVVRCGLAGEAQPEHPSLQDGYDVQCFTDSALESARIGKWVDVD